MRMRNVLIALVAVLALAVPVLAVAADHSLDWYVVAGGGGRMSSAEGHVLVGTAGQALVRLSSSDGYAMCSGFWCGVPAGRAVYLPLVVRQT